MAEEDFESLVEAFVERFGNGTEAEQRFIIALYRHLADGAPVGTQTLAESLGMSLEDVQASLDKLPSFYIGYDDEGRVLEWGGFGLDGGNNRFNIRGHDMWAWCAWDALFIPASVGEAASVSAEDPLSGKTVSLTVTASGVKDVQPLEAVMTFALPGMAAFPNFATFSFQKTVHFFESRASAETWARQNPGPVVVSLDEGIRLSRLMNQIRFPDFPAISSTVTVE